MYIKIDNDGCPIEAREIPNKNLRIVKCLLCGNCWRELIKNLIINKKNKYEKCACKWDPSCYSKH